MTDEAELITCEDCEGEFPEGDIILWGLDDVPLCLECVDRRNENEDDSEPVYLEGE